MTTPTLDDSQRSAVDLMLDARVAVVTGGPGVGKTTTLRAALDDLDKLEEPAPWTCQTCRGGCERCDFRGVEPGLRYLLCSPTGKAARRMFEATGREASTVHRALEYHPDKGWRRNAGRPIPADVVFVDEASMLDVEIAAALVDAIDPRRTRLVFIGDANQLPSVGPGRVFADLIASAAVPVARLTTLHRSAAESWVCSQAPRVLAGLRPALERREDFEWIDHENGEHVTAAILALVAGRLAGEDVQILAPQRRGSCGVDELNRKLQAQRNPRRPVEPMWKIGDEELRIRDRVIQTRNDYTLGVMNGEVGIVEEIRTDPMTMRVRFDDRDVFYSRGQANALELAYALTIHRSQGSEWPIVIVVCHASHSFMLSRSLLYTAITRAKRGVVLAGDAKGLARALDNVTSDKRNTSLAERMKST